MAGPICSLSRNSMCLCGLERPSAIVLPVLECLSHISAQLCYHQNPQNFPLFVLILAILYLTISPAHQRPKAPGFCEYSAFSEPNLAGEHQALVMLRSREYSPICPYFSHILSDNPICSSGSKSTGFPGVFCVF